ncbi:MAG: protein kinase family protein [Candidatus Pseudomonas phytovorans]|uniref:Protein kinase family protein n=1 Tax=Candidatus Pseudomonas phytovorans TaxID=3121377 RepID=A0AAJ6BCF5_9PSED|nr:protein kinase family protein [Pseudomonas sp.]WEK29601.1 MAG: protein kinase family protein [Pseudomonas sp.]
MEVSEELVWKIDSVDGHVVSEWRFKNRATPSRTSFFGFTEFNAQPAFIKLANPGSQYNSTLIEKEIEILKALNHLNVVKPLASGWHKFRTILDDVINVPYIIMPAYASDLEDLIISNGLRKWEDFIIIAQEVFESIKYIHQVGVIHGDICPANILIGAQPQKGTASFKLCDFGASIKIGECVSLRRGAMYYHTPPDEHLSFGFDWFSFGVLLSRLSSRDDIWHWFISSRNQALTFHPWVPVPAQDALTEAIKSFTSHCPGERESYSNVFISSIRGWK